MVKRTFISTEPQADLTGFDNLPTDRPVAIYFRQSTMAQVGNNSTSMQTIDMKVEMLRRGWAEKDIKLIDADAGVSGTLRIDQREGMQELYELISSGAIGAVACVDEDRLFRDLTQIQSNIFLDACFRMKVQVVTPSITYIFHHPTHGDFYKKQFRFKTEMAAEYLNVMKGRLGGARNRLRSEGKYAGGRVPLGYMVDYRINSPTYRRFVLWPEIAAIVVQVFETFVKCGCHPNTTRAALRALGIRFPDMRLTVPPDGFRYNDHSGSKSGFLSATAIRYMVSNPVYLGHWMYKGAITRWDNHAALIDTDLFYTCFNSVSPFSLNGEANPFFVPSGVRQMPRMTPERAAAPLPLLRGLVYYQVGEKQKRLGAQWLQASQFYGYIWHYTRNGQEVQKSRQASRIDEVVTFHMLERLREELKPEKLEATYAGEKSPSEREVDALLFKLQSATEDLDFLTEHILDYRTKDLIDAANRKSAAYREEILRTKVSLEGAKNRQDKPVIKRETEAYVREAVKTWHKVPFEEKMQFIRSMVRRVVITDWGGQSVHLTIFWHDPLAEPTLCVIWLRRGGAGWPYADQLRLTEMVQRRASKEEVVDAFPGRTWDAIRHSIHHFLPQYPPPRTVNPSPRWAARWKTDGSDTSVSENSSWSGFQNHYLRSVIPFPLDLLKVGGSRDRFHAIL